ncbi:TPA: hypothetical protein ABHN85_26040, partial [Pseudomonas sp. H2]|uniref:hypothetical protein n=1 Tax=Pseudomonas sp. H2 TaxID=658612 RepID=UPI003CF278FD
IGAEAVVANTPCPPFSPDMHLTANKPIRRKTFLNLKPNATGSSHLGGCIDLTGLFAVNPTRSREEAISRQGASWPKR